MLPYMKDNIERVEGDYMDMYNTGAYTGDMLVRQRSPAPSQRHEL